LFLSHGNGFAIDGYVPFWRPLLERFEVILFDFRNHGSNPPSAPENHHYAQMASDINRVLDGVEDRFGTKTSVGVFHSMSARAAMKHAIEVDWRWDALVLFDPPNVPPPGHPVYESMCRFENSLMRWARERRNRFHDPDQLARYYAESRAHRNWVPEAHYAMARAVLRHDASSGDWALVCPRELEALIYAAALTLNLWPPREAFAGPVALFGADPDCLGAPPTAAANRALHEEFGYRYAVVPDAGHLLQIERPQACIDALLKFLEETGVC